MKIEFWSFFEVKNGLFGQKCLFSNTKMTIFGQSWAFLDKKAISIQRSIAQNVVFVLKLDIFVKITKRDA